MNRRKSEKGSILPATIMLLTIMLLSLQTVLTVTAQHNIRSTDLIRQEQSRYLAASGWNMVIEQLQEVTITPEQAISLKVADVGEINSSWVFRGEQVVITAIGKAGNSKCTYQGIVQRKPIYPPKAEEEDVENSEESSLPEPIGYHLTLRERNID
ncbi:MAG: hypothetical protein IKM15_07325 [Peptococcaceae bacterium]|nr:hypothetical protein [Peptococcaceae bacterium]